MGDLFDILDAFPIDKGVPVTTDRSTSQRTKWDTKAFPFAKMEVGDSFSVSPPEGEPLIYTQNTVSGAASTFVNDLHDRYPAVPRRKFTTRQQKGHSVRCWRVA